MSARSIRRAREREIAKEQKRSLHKKGAVAAGAALGATVIFAPSAQAATFTVDTLADSDDGSCNVPAEDDCSLREAVEEANAEAGHDTITFASGLSGTIRLVNGQIDIYEEVTIQGPGAGVLAVSGRHDSNIFYIDVSNQGDAYDPVSISGLTLKNGYYSGYGGAINNDDANLTLEAMVFDNNYSTSSGGALYSDDGQVAIINSVFDGNQADSGGGAIFVSDTEGTTSETDVEVLISGSVFTDNFADGRGGALYFADGEGDHVIETTTVSGNEATDTGGGIYVDETDDDGDFTIRSSTISDNLSEEGGGGAYIEDVEGNILIENSTVSGNQAYYSGGGIYFDALYGADGETTTVRNSTIVNNVAGVDPYENGDYAGGGLFVFDADYAVNVSSTIVANNSADEGNDLGQDAGAEGFIVGHSLIEDPSDAEIAADPAGSNITGVDPLLGPLANNGGPTETHAPQPGSPVIDAGVANGLATDQRGAPRTVDRPEANRAGSDGTDIGSVELAAEPVVPTANCQGTELKRTDGTDGNDSLTGTDLPDAIFGLRGDDLIKGVTGGDCLDGGPGRDNLKGGGGNDLVKGVGGVDKLRGGGGKDKLKGGAGGDKITGDEGSDRLSGGAGKDRLRGGPAKDRYKGNGGADKINSVDNKRDKVNCGGGQDKATVDELDKVANNCEDVTNVDDKSDG